MEQSVEIDLDWSKNEETVKLSDPEEPRIKPSKNPWNNVPAITPDMEEAATRVLRNKEDTELFIHEIEGPTKEELISWEREVSEIMEGTDNQEV